MTRSEMLIREDYELVSGGLVDALDTAESAYRHLRKGDHGAALAELVALRERMGFHVAK